MMNGVKTDMINDKIALNKVRVFTLVCKIKTHIPHSAKSKDMRKTPKCLRVFYHKERFNIMKPKKYKNSKGEDRWQIQLYVGRDATGKQIN